MELDLAVGAFHPLPLISGCVLAVIDGIAGSGWKLSPSLPLKVWILFKVIRGAEPGQRCGDEVFQGTKQGGV